jgi:hypothetical protein
MSFRDYYSSLKNSPIELRDKICEKLGISIKTFYNKKDNDSWDYPQRVVISQILKMPIDSLFPEQKVY